ncbi:hypothetical protein [Sphingomicrobium aestuariivivum]|uniref:hypothetical protein n=1 Tax=Sphingomicrobium aestuariivivum TaxID=1582356 RepID=UPI001FD68E55|nr:hypothetical protein [Sphingomicrobium aestuariivivum]MCJ8191317.1 hypothetical protein [Sphingomicrobium aestuariivivum]
MRSRLPPVPGALFDAALAAGLVWFFAAVVFDRPERALEMSLVAGAAVFLAELFRRKATPKK